MITRKDVEKLTKDPTQYALMMNEHEIEQVIVDFVEVKNLRCRARGPP
jgi:hypothetical protein